MKTKEKAQKLSLPGGKNGKINYKPDDDIALLLAKEHSGPMKPAYKAILDHHLREYYSKKK